MNKPFVVVVDDRPEQAADTLAEQLNGSGVVNCTAVHPSEVSLEILERASLLLIDYQLEDWDSRSDTTELALKPKNGLALAGVLKEYCQKGQTAIALLSNQLDMLFETLSPDNRRHVLGRHASLEWVFSKNDPLRVEQIEILASGMAELRSLTSEGKLTARNALLMEEQLVIATENWDADVDHCIPPLNELAELTHGVAFARWFLQRVLPYPTFLIDQNYLATMLGIYPSVINSAIEQADPLADALDRFEYKGVFRQFLGRRWHKAFIEQWLWEITDQRSFDIEAVREAIALLAPNSLRIVEFSDPVVVVGDNFESTDHLLAREECIPIWPDDWPPYAQKAYVAKDALRERPELISLVQHDERWRLEE